MDESDLVGIQDKNRLSQRRYVPIEDAAKYLSVSTSTVRRMISRGELQGYRVGKGRLLRVDMGEVQSLAREIPSAQR